MLKKSKINKNLFPYPSFETSTLFTPPFITGSLSAEKGELEIVSSSNVARVGTKSLRHRNTVPVGGSVSHLYKDRPTLTDLSASIATVSQGETYEFSAYAKVSASSVDSVGSIALYELDSNGQLSTWESGENGGIKSARPVGLNESEWKEVSVTKTIKRSNTAGLGISFINRKKDSTIFWDDVSVRNVSANTDNIVDATNYELFVKKYEAGWTEYIFHLKHH